MSETIDMHSLELAANYIKVVRELLKDLYPDHIPITIQNKYKMQKLDSGLIDIQFPS